jgi:hypothetical protein
MTDPAPEGTGVQQDGPDHRKRCGVAPVVAAALCGLVIGAV